MFLGFAAVYIAKEALEQVVLGNGAHDHGGHGHGHGEHTGGDERPFPVLFLFLATAASAFSGAFLWNHSRLVDGEFHQCVADSSYWCNVPSSRTTLSPDSRKAQRIEEPIHPQHLGCGWRPRCCCSGRANVS